MLVKGDRQVGHYLTPKCQNPTTFFEKYHFLELKQFRDSNRQNHVIE